MDLSKDCEYHVIFYPLLFSLLISSSEQTLTLRESEK
jgi:hypothetical protein